VTLGTSHRPNRPRLRLRALSTIVLFCCATSCATLTDRGQPLVPTRYQLRTGPFIIFSNTPMTDDPPAVRCLLALERDLKKHLDFERRSDENPVEIYVLDSRNSFAHFLKFYFPELPPRRAFFLARGDERVVYTYASPRLEEDLRHEATHALLHGSFGDLPLWLDEGLAEYFEDDLAQPAVQRERIDHVLDDLAGGWSPDLARLESLADIRQMTPRDYREAWAWVNLLMNDREPGSSTLLSSLAESPGGSPRFRVAGQEATNERLLAHLKNCQSRLSTAAEVASPDRSVRLQDKAAEPPATNSSPPSRGFFQRFRAWIGL
jgi:hypothetical protein